MFIIGFLAGGSGGVAIAVVFVGVAVLVGGGDGVTERGLCCFLLFTLLSLLSLLLLCSLL